MKHNFERLKALTLPLSQAMNFDLGVYYFPENAANMPKKCVQKAKVRPMPFNDFMKELQNSLEAIQNSDPMRNLRKSFEAMQNNDPMRDLRKSIEAMQNGDPMRNLRKSIEAMQNIDPMRNYTKSLSSAMLEFDWSTVGISDSEVVANAVEVATEAVTAGTYQGAHGVGIELFEFLSTFFNQLRSSLDTPSFIRIAPVLWMLVVYIIIPIIPSIISSLYVVPAIQKFLGNEKEAISEIQKQLTADFDPSMISDFRIVRATSLNIRSSPSNESDVISSVKLGTVVRVLETRGTWTKVKIELTEGDSQVVGWAASGWMSKLSK